MKIIILRNIILPWSYRSGYDKKCFFYSDMPIIYCDHH